MSALGQKRTLQPDEMMSALPPKADIAERVGMSALCQKQTKCNVSKPVLTAAALRSKIMTSRISEEPA
jgi:hypothetical protein